MTLGFLGRTMICRVILLFSLTATVCYCAVELTPMSINATEGEDIMLTCNPVNSVAGATLSFVDDEPVALDQDRLVATNVGATSTQFTYSAVIPEENGGLLRCAQPDGQNPSNTVPLTVWFAPRLSLSVTQYSVLEGDNLTVVVGVKGNPLPGLAQLVVRPANNNNLQLDTENAVIFFEALSRDEAGSYKFEASNFVGNESIMFQIIVEYAPEFEVQVPLIEVTYAIGETYSLNCRANGVPAPTIQPLNSTVQFVENQYRISSATAADDGLYICQASNSAGNATLAYSVRFIEGPTITRIKTSYTSDNGIQVEWQYEDSSTFPITEFVIQLSGWGETLEEKTLPSDPAQVTFNPVSYTPGAPYSVLVKGKYMFGIASLMLDFNLPTEAATGDVTTGDVTTVGMSPSGSAGAVFAALFNVLLVSIVTVFMG